MCLNIKQLLQIFTLIIQKLWHTNILVSINGFFRYLGMWLCIHLVDAQWHKIVKENIETQSTPGIPYVLHVSHLSFWNFVSINVNKETNFNFVFTWLSWKKTKEKGDIWKHSDNGYRGEDKLLLNLTILNKTVLLLFINLKRK